MSTPLIILAIIALAIVVLISKGILIVPQSETQVIERLGRYDRTLQSGLNIIMPFVDRPREICTRISYQAPNGKTYAIIKTTKKIDLREQVYDFPKQSVITKDNVVT